MFIGNYKHKLDNKGRMFIPASLRKELITNEVIVTVIDSKTLIVMDKATWKPETFFERIDINNFTMKQLNYISSHSFSSIIDDQGRILLPKEAFRNLDIKGAVIISGMDSYIELKDEEAYKQEENAQMNEMSDIYRRTLTNK